MYKNQALSHQFERLMEKKDKLLQYVWTLEEEAKELERILQKEHADVLLMEEGSLKVSFYKILGQFEERLEKEQLEYVRARSNFEGKGEEIKGLRYQVEQIEEELKKLRKALKEDQEKKQEQLVVLRQKNEAFVLLEQEYINEHRVYREIQEAIQAGAALMPEIDTAKSLLNAARNWGTMDILGGGFIATMMKHDKLNQAELVFRHLQQRLGIFKRELMDVGKDIHAHLSLDAGLKFADYFFDGLIVDLTVQSKIKEASLQVDQLHTTVQEVDRNLRIMSLAKEEIMGKLEAKINQTLEEVSHES